MESPSSPLGRLVLLMQQRLTQPVPRAPVGMLSAEAALSLRAGTPYARFTSTACRRF